MQRLLFCFLILFFIRPQLQSQLFEHYYDSGAGDEDFCFSARPLSNGTIGIGAFRRTAGGGSTQAVLYLTDPAGRLDSVLFGPGNRRNSARWFDELGGGRYLLSATISPSLTSRRDNWVFTIYDNDFNVVEEKSYGNVSGDEQIRDLLVLPNGNVIAVGERGDVSRGVVALFDNDLNPIWRTQMNPPGSDLLINSSVTTDGNSFVVGGHYRAADGLSDTQMARFDQNGNMLWSYRYANPAGRSPHPAVSISREGNHYMIDEVNIEGISRVSILAVDNQGDVVNYGYFEGMVNAFVQDAIQTADGDFVLAGFYRDSQSKRRGFLLKTSPAGVVRWGREYERRLDFRFNSVAPYPTEGEGFLLGGVGTICEGTDQDIVLMRVDNEGYGGNECGVTDLQLTWVASEMIRSPLTQAQPYNDGNGLPLVFSPAAGERNTLVCPVLQPDPDQSSGTASPLEYRAPEDCVVDFVPIIDEDAILSGADLIERITVTLTNGPGDDRLRFNGTPPANLTGLGSREVTITANGLTDIELLDILRELYVQDASEASGERALEIIAFSGCEQSPLATTTFNATGGSAPTVTLPDTLAFCPGESVDLFTGLSPSYAITWSTGDTDDGLTVSYPGRYSFFAINECTEVSDSVFVLESGIDLEPAMDRTFELCLGDTARLDATILGADTYLWNDGISGPIRQFAEAGTYQLVASSVCDTTLQRVTVNTQNCCNIYLPNAFSPNNDGINDLFHAEYGSGNCNLISSWSLTIYDRWGGVVFFSNNPDQGWDGRRNGKSLGEGVYTFVLEYFDGLENRKEAGDITLLR